MGQCRHTKKKTHTAKIKSTKRMKKKKTEEMYGTRKYTMFLMGRKRQQNWIEKRKTTNIQLFSLPCFFASVWASLFFFFFLFCLYSVFSPLFHFFFFFVVHWLTDYWRLMLCGTHFSFVSLFLFFFVSFWPDVDFSKFHWTHNRRANDFCWIYCCSENVVFAIYLFALLLANFFLFFVFRFLDV